VGSERDGHADVERCEQEERRRLEDDDSGVIVHWANLMIGSARRPRRNSTVPRGARDLVCKNGPKDLLARETPRGSLLTTGRCEPRCVSLAM
jgi:hypothetical protein